MIKKQRILYLIILGAGFIITMRTGVASAQDKAERQQIYLTKNWKFRQSGVKHALQDSAHTLKHTKGKGGQSWTAAQVPGTIHTDLLAAHLIPEPYYRTNEKLLGWVSDADWDYQTTFKADKRLLAHEAIGLVFEGLDTYAKVYLNDSLIISADNMFLRWEFPLKGRLKEGENVLRVHFESSLKKVRPAYNRLPYKLPASNDQAEVKLSMFTRKAPYQYGWDWGPRLVTVGIWKPVYLVAWNTARLENVHFRQKSLTDQKASLTASIEIEGREGSHTVLLEVSSKRAGIHNLKTLVTLEKGIKQVDLEFSILKPKKWWPNGLGKAELYDFHTTLRSERGKLLDSSSRLIGLRTIEMMNTKDTSGGESFYLRINGSAVFMKGANYIPPDSFLPRVSRTRVDKLLDAAVESNMNMLRIWGGGVYESDYFYEGCDKRGLLVWQDFMFACSMYPADSSMVANISREARYTVRRLRDHPSLALWVGNNEIDVAWHDWGWQKQNHYSASDSTAIYSAYKQIFDQTLRGIVRRYDPGRFYMPTSPGWKADRSEIFKRGDVHYWDVWAGAAPIASYKTHIGRFMSEYGFQSLPSIRTIQAFTKPSDLNLDSAVLASHQRASVGNRRMLEYMERDYKVPQAFGDLLYVSQIQQAEAIKTAIEAHRRARNRCMGSLYWQLDDCWPAASWSSIDYYGRKKALYYMGKKAYSPILVSPVVEKSKINVYVISDQLTELNCTMRIQFQTIEGDQIVDKRFDVLIYPNSSHIYFAADRSSILKGLDTSTVLMRVSLSKGGIIFAQNTLYFAPVKSLPLELPEITYTVQRAGKAFWLTVHSYRLAKNIWLDTKGVECDFSDNYFDLLPGESRTVLVRPAIPILGLDDKLHIRSMNDLIN